MAVLPQVTAYTHKDDNNKWLVKKTNSGTSASESTPASESQSHSGTFLLPHYSIPGNSSAEVEFIRNGDWIILEHISYVHVPMLVTCHGPCNTPPMCIIVPDCIYVPS